jgi:endonuclease/exonuclease/phosphatase family metal-dependent hydrolase
MTYNVHSCIGTDGKVSPVRIAHVIAGRKADIVALQELDSGLSRTGLSDQAKVIADHLSMHYHFHPSMRIEKGHYGNAILSRFPMRTVRASELPTLPGRRAIERRGALWAEVSIGELTIQVIATHFGLNRQERLAQAETLLSSEWLQHRLCRPPVVLCGDFNTVPFSRVYRWLTKPMNDTRENSKFRLTHSTYPSRFPFLRLDYILVSPDVAVRECIICRDPLTRVASDHLPLMATLELRWSGADA